MPELPHAYNSLPLFPLNVVLFPQSKLSLHIFEDRYKEMISECYEHTTSFGINLIYEQQIRTVGCTARILEITKRYFDGRFDIVVEGIQRYVLHGIEESSKPYFIGKVQPMEDEDESRDEKLLEKAVEMYNEFVSIVYPVIVKKIPREEQKRIHSFYLAQKAGLDVLQRHIILSMNSEIRRLQFIIQHFEATLPLLASKNVVEELAKQDGYIQQ
ncbi:MAG: LON peptidase substrate-binding domain-containing protein [Bacteroidetes bacterium]|nr:LON peptidase substrate-binding domain-containing protein [Bacteroidota bacterium]